MNWNSSSGGYEPHPEGSFLAVCVDVYDNVVKNKFLGQVDKMSGKVDRRETQTVAYIVFFTSEGETVRFKANATLGKSDKPSNLRKFLKGWNPRITDAHLEQFNPETILGWSAYITVSHRESKGNTYANVTVAQAPPPGSPIPNIPAEFIRFNEKGTAQPVATSPVTNDPQAAYAAPPSGIKDMPPAGQIVGDNEDDLPF